MEKENWEIIEQYKQQFKNSQSIFKELENNIKNYGNGHWGTSRLLEKVPFEFERNQIKIGKKLSREPKNKAGKFFHREDDNGNIISVEGYIENYNLPGDYLFIKRGNNAIEYYYFDIQRIIISIGISCYEKNKITESIYIGKNAEIVFEEYICDNENKLIKINREHKDKNIFRDENYFPENIYKSIFTIEYDGNNNFPNKIYWDKKIVWENKKPKRRLTNLQKK
jgi:hypothetical protein